MLPMEFNDTANWLITVVVGAIGIGAALHALLTKRDSKSALAWVAICLLIPLLGPLLYLVLGINRITAKAQISYSPDRSNEEFGLSDINKDEPWPLSVVGRTVSGRGLFSCDEITTLQNGEALFPAMVRDIQGAKEKVYCSTYIFQNDQSGRLLLAEFSAAQQRGVDVRIIVDGLGGKAYPPKILSSLRAKKLNFKLFNPITLFPPSLHINMRNHRKILVIDNDCAYTGGQNLSDRHLIDKSNNPK
ncbi:MAG: hypothetical protein GKR91_13065 [Pseudomonadales bacterium]|nr:hypothetical protein [Pseudomonadales bacterium]